MKDDVKPSISVIKIIPLAPPKLGEDAYHGLAGDFLRAVGPYTEATDAGVLGHLLPAVGTLIGPKPFIFAGSRQPARLNLVLVGPTNSGRKGTSKAPVDELMNRVDKPFWQAQQVGGLSSGEGLIQKLADQRTEGEDGSTTITAVEKRLFVVEEEFSKVLANIKRESNILSQIMREAFDSGNLSTLTVNPRQAYGAHVSVVGHITPEELAARLDHIEMANGFGNRFLWFLVQSDKLIARPRPIPATLFRKFVPMLRNISDLDSQSIELGSDAMDLWESVYPKLREDRPGIAGAMIARGSAIILRLALLYTLMDDGKVKSIGLEHLKAALAVWEYGRESAEMLFQSQTGDKLQDKLLQLLRNGPMTKTEFNKHLSPSQKRGVDAALTALVTGKFISKTKIKRKGAGCPAQQWKLRRPPN